MQPSEYRSYNDAELERFLASLRRVRIRKVAGRLLRLGLITFWKQFRHFRCQDILAGTFLKIGYAVLD